MPPGPARQDSPVVARIGREEARIAKCPAAIGIAQCGVLGAVIGVVDHERIAPPEYLGAIRSHFCSALAWSGAGRHDRRGLLRCDDEQHILTSPLVGTLGQARQYRRPRYRSRLQDDGWKVAARCWCKDADIEREFSGWPKGQVNLPVFDRAIQHQF